MDEMSCCESCGQSLVSMRMISVCRNPYNHPVLFRILFYERYFFLYTSSRFKLEKKDSMTELSYPSSFPKRRSHGGLHFDLYGNAARKGDRIMRLPHLLFLTAKQKEA